MPDVKLRFACALYDRMLPLYTREVQPEGIDLEFVMINDPRETFDRMVRDLAFDLSEMSSSEFISRMSRGQCPFVALPVFPSRLFRHGFITINRRSGIRHPKDMQGRRIGVQLYTMTAAVFIRGLLQHEYGVDLSTIHWVQGAMDAPGAHGSPTVLPLLKPVSIEINTSNHSLSELLERGEIDAIIGATLPKSLRTNSDIARLFPDYDQAEAAYYRKTRIFPIMHLVAIRRDVYEAHPFIAESLYRAFCDAKALALEHMRFSGALRYMLPWLMTSVDQIDDVFEGDPWPYGVEANRPTLEALAMYLAEQAIIPAPIKVDDLFVPV
ncbi:MAG: ABC transporter substrate-binding protein [Rhizobiales bacterium]|nr:ABC transporter substrate-binding protein [Hyphomicrobiales bacterium]